MIVDVDDESLGVHTNQALTMCAIRLSRHFCSVLSKLVVSLLCCLLPYHWHHGRPRKQHDIPDLPAPAMGTDTGAGVADYPPTNMSTPVPNGPNIFVLVIGDPSGRWRDQFQRNPFSTMSKVSGMLGNVRH